MECGDSQFAKNLACRKCGSPKPITAKNNVIAKKGDWICPNPICRDVQFERNQNCRRCGMAKPVGVAPSAITEEKAIGGGRGRVCDAVDTCARILGDQPEHSYDSWLQHPPGHRGPCAESPSPTGAHQLRQRHTPLCFAMCLSMTSQDPALNCSNHVRSGDATP